MTDKPEHNGLDNKPSGEKDRVDLSLELSGLPVGRIQRFSVSDVQTIYGENAEKKKSDRAYCSMLHLLLLEDARYAQLYRRIENKLDKAYRAVDLALMDIDKQLLETKDEMEYQRLLEHKEAIETYRREVLDDTKQRLNDENEPPSLEELQEMEDDIETQMPSVLSDYFLDSGLTSTPSSDKSLSVAQEVSDTKLNTPPLLQDFESVRHGVREPPSLMSAPAAQSFTLSS